MIKTKECRREKRKFVLASSLRTPDPSLLRGTPGLLITLPRNWLSQYLLKFLWYFIMKSLSYNAIHLLRNWNFIFLNHCFFCLSFKNKHGYGSNKVFFFLIATGIFFKLSFYFREYVTECNILNFICLFWLWFYVWIIYLLLSPL